MSSTELALFSVAKEALAEAVRVDEVKGVRDHAERIRLYGQQAGDRSIIADATEIIMRAERRLGELLTAAHQTGQLGIGRPARSNLDEGTEEAASDATEDGGRTVQQPLRVTLKEAGISKKLSTRSQQLAAVTETAFEAALQKARDKIVAGGAVVVNPMKDLSSAEKKAQRAAKEMALGAKQMALPEAKFGVILTDDEWKFETWSEDGMDRSAENHYPTSTIDALKKRDVESLAAPDAAYWMWTTVPFLAVAIELMAHRGFTYKSSVVWHKLYPGDRTGMGRWFWVNHEILLLGTRGKVPAPAPGTQWPSVIAAPVDPIHSRKPEVFYELIEAYFPSLPKVELNARVARDGWVRWGYEAPEQDPHAKLDHSALNTADLDLTRVHLANCIMNCGARIYEGDDHHVTPTDEFYCSECMQPQPLEKADAIILAGDAEKTPLAVLAEMVGRPGNVTFVKNSRRRQGLSSRDRQREAVAEANRRRAAK